MTLENTIKKAEKISGEKIQFNGCQFWVNYKGHIVSFHANGRIEPGCESTCFYTSNRARTYEDHMTDYFPGTFHDNITQAFKFVDRNNYK